MGRFTEDMGRLRDEIDSDRLARHVQAANTRQVISDLKDQVAALQTDFREAHADMAEAGRADRNAFLAHIGNAVADIKHQAVGLVDDFVEERRAGAQAWRTGAAKLARTAEPVKPAHKAKPKTAVHP
jgi:polyhydroxyalkanoate synthesis regulator phasin